MGPSIWCILYTSKVIKGNAFTYTTRIAWHCLFSYVVSELWRDGLWACSQLSSYSWWGCEYNIYCCWQNYTSNFIGKADVCELYYWLASVSVGHPTGALSIFCRWVLLTWLTYAYGMLCQDDVAPVEFLLLQCVFQLFWTEHINSCMFMINYWSLYHQAACLPCLVLVLDHQSFGRSWGVIWWLYCESRVRSSTIDHSQTFRCLIINKIL